MSPTCHHMQSQEKNIPASVISKEQKPRPKDQNQVSSNWEVWSGDHYYIIVNVVLPYGWYSFLTEMGFSLD